MARANGRGRVGSELTSDSRRGVPGCEPWPELVRESGGLQSMRRPYLSTLTAGEAVRDVDDVVRFMSVALSTCFRCSAGLCRSLLALTKALAACDSYSCKTRQRESC